MTATKKPEAGDIVFIGEPAPLTHKVTWRVQAIREEGGVEYAYLTSGQTDRSRREPLSRLSPFRVMENA